MSFFRLVAAVVVAALVIPLLLIGGCQVRSVWKQKRLAKEQEARAKEEFAPALSKIDEAIKAAKAEKSAYDLDKTIRVIHEIDQALQHREDFRSYMAEVARQDFRGVAPDVLAARRGIVNVLQEIYARQVDLENQKSAWSITSQFLVSSIASVSLSLDGGLGGSVGADRSLIQSYLTELKAANAKKQSLIHDIEAQEGELLDAFGSYAEVYHRYIAEWDKLCGFRDHAYLAANNHDSQTVLDSTQAAIDMAPQEREAHLLRAMALLNQMGAFESPATSKQAQEFQALLADYEEQHPDSTAPAHLLRGNFQRLIGDQIQARNQYDHASAYYPKQAEQLGDMLNPYRYRAFLRKSREGNHIVRQYENTMRGAGYFSPDLQTADMLYHDGKIDEGDRKVLDHFARRRIQGEWDFVISDIQFCQQIMGADFERIFPPVGWVDLVLDESAISQQMLKVAVRNRSDRPIRNATLVLCINFSDMYPDDYRTWVAGDTAPVLAPGQTVKYGNLSIETEVFGHRKTAVDIVAARAILVSNDAVIWVDTDSYRIAELTSRLRDSGSRPAAAIGDVGPISSGETRKLISDAAFSLVPDIGKDHIDVALPGKLAVLSPFFRLILSGKEVKPDTNVIENGTIRLRFNDAADLDREHPSIGFRIYSPWGDYEQSVETKAQGSGYLLDAKLRN